MKTSVSNEKSACRRSRWLRGHTLLSNFFAKTKKFETVFACSYGAQVEYLGKKCSKISWHCPFKVWTFFWPNKSPQSFFTICWPKHVICWVVLEVKYFKCKHSEAMKDKVYVKDSRRNKTQNKIRFADVKQIWIIFYIYNNDL